MVYEVGPLLVLALELIKQNESKLGALYTVNNNNNDDDNNDIFIFRG